MIPCTSTIFRSRTQIIQDKSNLHRKLDWRYTVNIYYINTFVNLQPENFAWEAQKTYLAVFGPVRSVPFLWANDDRSSIDDFSHSSEVLRGQSAFLGDVSNYLRFRKQRRIKFGKMVV